MVIPTNCKLIMKMLCRNLYRRRIKNVCFVLLLVFAVLILNLTHLLLTDDRFTKNSEFFYASDGEKFIQKFPDVKWQNKTVKKILTWTTFFDSWEYFEDAKTNCLPSCPYNCTVTKNKSEVLDSDAVIFHPNDVWKYKGFPSYFYQSLIDVPKVRQPNQVYVWFNMEPTIFLWGKDLSNFYNWTMSYRNDSTIHMPYGKFFKLTEEEKQARAKNVFDLLKKKTRMAAALISNCYDQTYRYRIIGELRRYGVDISVYGNCGSGKICFNEDGNQDKNYKCMEDFLKTFKFYFAIENSHCRDYISEKFWMVLSRDQIPVVAWRQHLKNYAPPGSYINLFDFPSFKEAAEYLLEVAINESLYNSYFKWKYEYKVGGELCNFCKICKTLHTPMPAQVYSDLDGWVGDDTCKKTSVSTLISSYIRRKLYDIGLVS